MSSENRRSGRSHPPIAPPTLLDIAPSTASSMPPTNPKPSLVYPANPQNIRMPSHSEPSLDPRLDPLLARPGIPTGLETPTEDAHPRPVHAVPGKIAPGQSFHVNVPVSTAHGIGLGTVPVSGHIGILGERNARSGIPHTQDNGESRIEQRNNSSDMTIRCRPG